VKMLIQSGAEFEIVDRSGETALTTAVRRRRRETVKILLEAHADPKSGLNLWYASMAGDVEMVKLLLDAGASPNIPGPRGRTGLFEAARSGHTEVVGALLEAGADPNLRTADGVTPLERVRWEMEQHPQEPALKEILELLRKAGGRG
jgi:cytohesin